MSEAEILAAIAPIVEVRLGEESRPDPRLTLDMSTGAAACDGPGGRRVRDPVGAVRRLEVRLLVLAPFSDDLSVP